MEFEFEFEAKGPITEPDLNAYEKQKGFVLPEEYRLHMLDWNGGGVNIPLNYKDEDGFELALSSLYPLANDILTLVTVNDMLEHILPEGYIVIGSTRAGLDIIICVESGEKYGEIKAMRETSELIYIAPSLTQYFNQLVIDEDYID